jgi:hypothetical protein
MMVRCGMTNILKNHSRYPQLTAAEISVLNPELVLLATEPYPFGDEHIQEFKSLLPSSQILIVDGEFFSWYGSRLIDAPNYFNTVRELLN